MRAHTKQKNKKTGNNKNKKQRPKGAAKTKCIFIIGWTNTGNWGQVTKICVEANGKFLKIYI